MALAEQKTTIRPAVTTDLAEIVRIYNYEVEHSLNNYENQPQSIDQRQAWLERLQEINYPVLVAEREDRVIGFAALTPFHPLSGYRFTVTGSIYVDCQFRQMGVARCLGEAILKEARQRNFHTIIAGINSKNTASIELHKAFGFQQVGHFREIGFKNGSWHDDVCLQLHLK